MSTQINVHADPEVVGVVKELALEGFKGAGKSEIGSNEKYRRLTEIGSALWMDTGDFDAASKVWAAEFDALTTNNTLVNQVVQTGAMDGVIGYAAEKIRASRPDISEQDLIIEIAFLVNARLALGLVERLGAHVSVELHPGTAFDVEQSLAFARRYYDINKEYFYVKIPLTPDGFVATRRLAAEGIPVNYTLGFSARQNYLAARFSKPKYVNVFLGRLNSLVEENGLGDPENVGEKAALASNELVKELREGGDVPTFQIAASIRNGRQLATLAGIDVLTIPPKAAAEYLAADIPAEQVRKHTSGELGIRLAKEGLAKVVDLSSLWEVDDRFVAFVEDAAQRGDEMAYGRDLVNVAREHGIDIFHEWTKEERRLIREHGKIPDLSQWPGAPLDDLMSISALESFAQDQSSLDERIKGLLPE